MFPNSVFTRFFNKQIGDDKCSDFVLRKQELSFWNNCFIFAAVTIFVYRYDRMTVSIRISCPLYRYCIDTDCIVPALKSKRFMVETNSGGEIITTYIGYVNLKYVQRQKVADSEGRSCLRAP